MKAQQAAEVLAAVRAEQERRGVDTRPLCIICIPRPPGEHVIDNPRNPRRVVLLQDLPADDPNRLAIEAEMAAGRARYAADMQAATRARESDRKR
jgi:hypothetical protein